MEKNLKMNTTQLTAKEIVLRDNRRVYDTDGNLLFETAQSIFNKREPQTETIKKSVVAFNSTYGKGYDPEKMDECVAILEKLADTDAGNVIEVHSIICDALQLLQSARIK